MEKKEKEDILNTDFKDPDIPVTEEQLKKGLRSISGNRVFTEEELEKRRQKVK